jgi:CO dehydrogenase maturation factor
MSTTIAIAGKGGSGKTTVAAMIVRHLVERGAGSVLAVDADANACLGLALGLAPSTTVADIREATLKREIQPGLGASRERAFEYALQQAVAEAKGFDLLAMGRPEGPSCYCAVNHLLRRYLDEASRQYAWVVVDNEAGMEHLSRRTTDDVDHLVVVAEATAVGALTARRIFDLANRLPVTVHRRALLWNQVRPGAAAGGDAGTGVPVIGLVPYDPAVYDASLRGATVFDLEARSPAFAAVGEAVAALVGAAAGRIR